ncbi:MAG: amphi-Trp domain-containing protein [Methanothrix sp.]|nr:amphi-Trp domain-containing protein [Methanothrix sp.]
MAKLSGNPGKISLKISSEEGFEEFEQEFFMTGPEAASFLRELAEEIEAGGEVEASYEGCSISVRPATPIRVEVEYEKDGLEIEIKLKEAR